MLTMPRLIRWFPKTLLLSLLAFPALAETLPGLQDCVSVGSGDYIYARDYSATTPTRDCKISVGVTPLGIAAGPNGAVQFNNSSALAGSSSFVWDSANNRLGIGTSSPSASLDVYGAGKFDTGKILLSNTGTLPGIWFGSTAVSSPNSSNYAFLSQSGTGTFLNAPAGEVLDLRVGNTTVGRINSSGYSVTGTLASTGNATFANGTAGGSVTIGQAAALQGYTHASVPTLFTGKITSLSSFNIANLWGNLPNNIDIYGTWNSTGVNFTAGAGLIFWNGTVSISATEARLRRGGTKIVTLDDGAGGSATLDVTGSVGIGIGSNAPSAGLHVNAASAGAKGAIVRGTSAQTANLQEWQDSSGTSLFNATSAGDLVFNQSSTGVVLEAPDGGLWRLIVDNSGALSTEAYP